MSVPVPPQFEGMRPQRTFSFFPPILGIANNEWVYRQASWSEVCVFNQAANLEVWIPRRHLGNVSRVEEPMPIIGLTKELEYKAGSIVPTVKRVIEMPRAVNEGPRPSAPAQADGEVPAAAPLEHAPRISGIRLDPAETKIGKLLLGVVAAAVIAVVVLVGLYRQSVNHVTYSPVMQSDITFTQRDDYFNVTAKLGQPEDDRWQAENGEIQFRYLWYPKQNLRVVLMGPDRKDARYIGELNKEWQVVHATDDNMKQILRRVKRF